MTTLDLPVHPFTGLAALAVLPSGRPVWPVLGGAPDEDEETETEQEEQDAETEGGDGQGDEGEQAEEEDTPLGPAGQKALEAEKARRKAEAERRRAAEARVAELEAQHGTEADQERRKVERAATARANERLVRAEIKAAAKGKFADPTDVHLYIKPDQFEVGPDGEIDEDEIAAAVDDLLKKKPHLAAQGGRRFSSSGDGGARTGQSRPRQLTEADLQKMTPAQIVEAQDKGLLDDLLGKQR